MGKPAVRRADSIASREVDRLSDRARFVAAIEEGLADESAGLLSPHADVEARAKARFRVEARAMSTSRKVTGRRAP